MSENIDINVGIIKEEISINAANNIVEVNISTAPVTIINPQNYDLSQFTNTSPNPFVRTSGLSSYVPISRTLTINGVTQDLSADRTFTISTGITIGSTAITSGTVGRILFEGAGNVVQESSSLFWDATNNRLGIGTSSPSVQLELQGTFHGYNDVYAQRGTNMIGLTNWSVNGNKPTLYAQTDIFISPNIGNAFVFKESGNLLINTTTDAGFRLDVNGNFRADRGYFTTGIDAKIISLGDGFNNNQRIEYNTTSGLFSIKLSGSNILSAIYNGDTVIAPVRNDINNLGDVVIQGGGSERARFKANGNVGIGTSTPSAKLDVLDSGNSWTRLYGSYLELGLAAESFPRVRIQRDIVGPAGGIVFSFGVNPQQFGSAISQNGTANLVFLTSNGTALTEGMRLTSTRNLLINTTTDSGYRLDVNGTARISNATWDGTALLLQGPSSGRALHVLENSLVLFDSPLTMRGSLINFYEPTGLSTATTLGEITSGGAHWSASNVTRILFAASGGVWSGSSKPTKITFSTTNVGNITATEKISIEPSGNFLIGTTADAGYKLDVNGNIRGSNNLLITNIIANSGQLSLEPGASGSRIRLKAGHGLTDGVVIDSDLNSVTSTGDYSVLRLALNFTPTSGNSIKNYITVNPTINQTGTATGITRGLYINPTLTAAADFRAIETTAGNVLFGSNFFWDNTNGRLGIGTSTPTVPIHGLVNNQNIVARFEATGTGEGNIEMNGLAPQLRATTTNGASGFRVSVFGATTGDILRVQDSSTTLINVKKTGNVLINTTTDAGFRLDVNGTARVVTSILVGASSGTGTVQTGVCRASYFNSYDNNFTIFQTNDSTGNAKFYQGVSVGTSSDPVASAQVEIVSTTKGFLPPRMTTTQINAIASPAEGLMVYNTTISHMCVYQAGSWVKLSHSPM